MPYSIRMFLTGFTVLTCVKVCAQSDWSIDFATQPMTMTDARAEMVNGALQINLGKTSPWPGVRLNCPSGVWDLSRYRHIEVDISNHGETELPLHVRVDNALTTENGKSITAGIHVAAQSRATLHVPLGQFPLRLDEPLTPELVGMRGAPRYNTQFTPAGITHLIIFVARGATEHHLTIHSIRATDTVTVYRAEGFMPFVDAYGQFMHTTWPGKIDTDSNLETQRTEEGQELMQRPGPVGRNHFGGWMLGPQREGNGTFRPEKIDGQWWLVDPDGRLFWSLGMDCVRHENPTALDDRETYFTHLPSASTSPKGLYGQAMASSHSYFTNRSVRTFDFCRSNLLRKYGDTWERISDTLAFQRLRAWGFNTFGNWSDPSVYMQRCMPYTVAIHFNAPVIAASQGYWKAFPDPFHPDFTRHARARLQAEVGQTAEDGWCLGYFVDNELDWHKDPCTLPESVLASPSGQQAKIAFIGDLRKKYDTIDALNAAWGTAHVSWEALLSETNKPPRAAAQADLEAFAQRLVDRYFRVIRDAIEAVAPNRLYLGCRFSNYNDIAVRSAARYVDVLSFNVYRKDLEDFRLPEDVDKPVLIGEFHFGALDRGMFSPGLQSTPHQMARATAFDLYVRSALKHPNIVGVHWFQYRDQPLTGRPLDGENYNIGFVNVTDHPYAEMVEKARAIAEDMYPYRLRGQP